MLLEIFAFETDKNFTELLSNGICVLKKEVSSIYVTDEIMSLSVFDVANEMKTELPKYIYLKAYVDGNNVENMNRNFGV